MKIMGWTMCWSEILLSCLDFGRGFSPVSRWGRTYKRYLKEHHPARYQVLLLSGRLNTYLADIDAQAEEQLKLLTQQMAEREGVNEELKAANQMEWVQRMNRIQNRAEEAIKAELIFA